MALNLVTGYKGRDHITAEQWADFNRGIFGEAAILPVGNKMAVAIQTANQITVKDGVAVFDGREVYIGYGESENITIQSGTQGMQRRDIVVVKYTRNEETGVEEVAFEVVNGLPASSNPEDPVYQNTDIRTGVFVSQKPFCRVRINGTAIEGIDMLVAEKKFKTVAFTGNYNDLSNRPALKAVATSGSYNDLTNKPASLPAKGGDAATVGGKNTETLQNYNNLTNKPNLGGAASQGVANNFTTNTAGYVADARTVKQLKDDLSKKIVSKSGNISFKDGGNGESYGYITIPSGYEMLAVYMQEVSGNVKLRCKGFNKNAGTGGYTVWLDFAINSNVFMHWIYAKI